MKKLLAATSVAVFGLCLSGIATADTIVETWTCKVEEGTEMEDVQAINSKWLKWIKDHVDGDDITSSVGTSIVGNIESFIFVDSYPDLATWAAAKEALDSADGDEIDELFEGISDCTDNRLWKLEETK